MHKGTHKQLKCVLFQEMDNTTRETSQISLQPIGRNKLSMSRLESNISEKEWEQSKKVGFCVCLYVYMHIYRTWKLSQGAKDK